MQDLKSFLNNFLEIINYDGDRAQFTGQFLTTIYLDTIDELLKTLPDERRASIKQSLESAKTPQLLQQTVETYFDNETFNKTFQNKTSEMFTDYLKTIDTALTSEQKSKLKDFFVSNANTDLAQKLLEGRS